jgi:hypothetical protein
MMEADELVLGDGDLEVARQLDEENVGTELFL